MENDPKTPPGRPRRDPNERYKCPYCEKTYKKRDGRWKHIQKHHKEEWERDKGGKVKNYGEKVQKYKLEVIHIPEKEKEGEKPPEDKKEDKTTFHCPSCGEKVGENATKCWNCGAEFDEE